MARNPPGPTKTDLLRVIQSYEKVDGPAVVRAYLEEKAAEKALADFDYHCQQRQSLSKAVEEIRERRWAEEREWYRWLTSLLREVRNEVLTRGPTPEVVARVEALAADLKFGPKGTDEGD